MVDNDATQNAVHSAKITVQLVGNLTSGNDEVCAASAGALWNMVANAGARADIVKFQTFKSNNLVTKETKKAFYQSLNTDNNDSQLEMLKKLELTHDEQIDLKNYYRNIYQHDKIKLA